jgi:hypothetical protein
MKEKKHAIIPIIPPDDAGMKRKMIQPITISNPSSGIPITTFYINLPVKRKKVYTQDGVTLTVSVKKGVMTAYANMEVDNKKIIT